MTFNVNWGTTLVYRSFQKQEDLAKESGREIHFTYDNGCPPEPLNSLMWAMMSIGMNQIKYSNAAEVYARCKVFEKYFLNGVWRRDWSGEEPVDVTLQPADVLMCVGMSANVNRETTAAWTTRTCKNIMKQFDAVEGVSDIRGELNKWKEQFDGTAVPVSEFVNPAWSVQS
jgi:hypothetical protein